MPSWPIGPPEFSEWPISYLHPEVSAWFRLFVSALEIILCAFLENIFSQSFFDTVDLWHNLGLDDCEFLWDQDLPAIRILVCLWLKKDLITYQIPLVSESAAPGQDTEIFFSHDPDAFYVSKEIEQ